VQRNKRQIARDRKAKASVGGDTVPALYQGETAVLLATGPSLCDADIEYIRPLHERGEIRVFGLGDAYRICDFLDVFYGCDPRWFECNLEVLKHPCKQKWTQDKKYADKHPELMHVSGSSGQGMSLKPSHIHFGSNSGYQLINLAVHYGIERFLLLGYNMDVPKGQKQHFFGPHPKPLNQGNNYRGFAKIYGTIQPDIKKKIINCTYPTMLTAFAQMPLEKALGREPRSSQPEQSTAKKPAIPRKTNRTFIPGLYGGPSSDGPVARQEPTRTFIPCAYGG
jgi:hypothetical protein